MQIKDLTAQINASEENKKAVELEFQNAVKKIWSLREVIQDLENQLAEVSERENNLKKKIDNLNSRLEEQFKINKEIKNEVKKFFFLNLFSN